MLKRLTVIIIALSILVTVLVCIRRQRRRAQLEFKRRLWWGVLRGYVVPTIGTSGRW